MGDDGCRNQINWSFRCGLYHLFHNSIAQLWRAIHSFYLAFMIFIIVYDSGKSLIRLSYLVPVTSTGKFEVKTLN